MFESQYKTNSQHSNVLEPIRFKAVKQLQPRGGNRNKTKGKQRCQVSFILLDYKIIQNLIQQLYRELFSLISFREIYRKRNFHDYYGKLTSGCVNNRHISQDGHRASEVGVGGGTKG